jgi:serine/threonine protein kinase
VAALKLLADPSVPFVPEVEAEGETSHLGYNQFIAMVPVGEPLTSADRPGTLLRVLADAAEALELSAERGVINRDVKPGNLAKCNGRGLLLDWNAADFKGSGVHPASGTQRYRSITVLLGEKHVHEDDVEGLFYATIDLCLSDNMVTMQGHPRSKDAAVKLGTMCTPELLEQKLLGRIDPRMRGFIAELHSLFFKKSNSGNSFEYKRTERVRGKDFKEVCERHLHLL